jgi:uncharacterized protein YecT (DUF1311 family)
MKIAGLLSGLVVAAATAATAQEPRWSPGATQACLDRAPDLTSREACIGLSTALCIDSPGGQTTLGMSTCLSEELGWWDGRLNTSYRALLDRQKALDAGDRRAGYADAARASNLLNMQRTWIPFRDATCAFEHAQWGGGSGGGPARVDCLMRLTAVQALYLQDQLEGWQ